MTLVISVAPGECDGATRSPVAPVGTHHWLATAATHKGASDSSTRRY